MQASSDLVERSGALKQELVHFAQQPPFARRLRQQLRRRVDQRGPMNDSKLIDLLDRFILEHRLADGRTVVEHFVRKHPELPEEERAMLLGWRDVVEGIFQIQRPEGEALVVVNLIDDLTYRVRSNMGPAVFARMQPGSFLVARLVPVSDEWLLSGTMSTIPAADRDEVYSLAAEVATQHPSLVFRNPERLARGWELQREERDHFIAFFGSDVVVLPGSELAERMRAYAHFRTYEVRNAEGKSAADRAQELHGVVPREPEFPIPADLSAADTVGIIYDEVEGLSFFANFAVLEETFADPALAARRDHRQAVLGYLKAPSVSPLPFRRLAERDPDRASRVFERILKQPGFQWERDGESLLRRYKASHYERPVLPSVTPLSGALVRAKLAASDAGHT